jgi:hypothetical protein
MNYVLRRFVYVVPLVDVNTDLLGLTHQIQIFDQQLHNKSRSSEFGP